MRKTPTLIAFALLALCPTLPTAADAAKGHPHQAARHESSARRHGAAPRHTTGAAKHGRPRVNETAETGGTRAAPEHALKGRGGSSRHSRKVEEAPAEQAAATIAAVLAVPCQDTEVTPQPANIALARAAVLCLINRVRAEHGLEPLRANSQLEAAAEGHSSELVADNYFAHVSPSGETPVDRIRQTGYIASESDGYVIGENLAWGTYSLSTPKAIVEAWVASPGHLANILEGRYRDTGVGIAPAVPPSLGEGNPGATYAEEFGVIVH